MSLTDKEFIELGKKAYEENRKRLIEEGIREGCFREEIYQALLKYSNNELYKRVYGPAFNYTR